MARILSEWSQLDILVNNAGVNGAPGSDHVSEAREVDWDMAFDVNVKGVMRCTRAVMDHCTARGSGRIVNIASIAARYPRPMTDYYAVSKTGVVAYPQATARRLGVPTASTSTRCARARCGPTLPPLVDEDAPGRGLESLGERDPHEVFAEGSRSINPMNREISAEDVAGVVVFLSSDLARLSPASRSRSMAAR